MLWLGHWSNSKRARRRQQGIGLFESGQRPVTGKNPTGRSTPWATGRIFSCNWLLTSIYKHQAFRHANEQWVLEWLFRDLLHLSLNSPSLFSAYDISSILVTTCEAYLNTSRLLRIPRYPPPFLRMPLNKSPPHFHPPYCHVWLPQRISIQQIESAKAASFSWAMTTDKTCDDFLTGRPAFSRDIYTRSLNSARVRDAEGQAGMPIHCAGSPSSWNKELG